MKARRNINLATIGLAAAFFAMATHAEAIELVHGNKSKAVIVIEKSADSQLREAADTLQSYLQQSTGAKLPIQTSPGKGPSIYLGQTAYALSHHIAPRTNDPDGFVIKSTADGNIAIIGGSDWGTEFGVYDFLERYLGVRWLMPTALGTDVPKNPTLDVPAATIYEEPVYLSRQLSPVNINANTPLDQWGRFNRARGCIAFHHNLLNLYSPSKFSKSHPELYPIINGKRYIPLSNKDPGWQPNLSAPDSVSIAVQQIDAYFQSHPESESYSLGMNDSNNWDQSAASKRRRSGRKNYLGLEDISDDYFTWANAVTKDVLAKYPGKHFGMLAYNGLAEPPEKTGVNSSIIPFITYDRMQWLNPALRDAGHQLNERWEKASPSLGWYDYVYGISYLLPRVYFHEMQKYLSWGASHHVKYYYAELYPNWGEGPKAWVLTKLLWNPNQNVDALLDDWYQHFAGTAAAPKLKEFYALWERFWTKEIEESKFGDGKQYLPFGADPRYLLDVTSSELARADQLMNQALQLADTPERKARVAKLLQMWHFYKASVVAYQGEHSALAGSGKAASDAEIHTAEATTQASETREQLLKEFAKEPLYAQSASYITRYPATAGDTWSQSALWGLLYASVKNPELSGRLAHSSVAYIRQQAALMGKVRVEKSALISENPSFESELKGWSLWDKANEAPQFHKGNFSVVATMAKDGHHSLMIRGLQRGAVMQTIPYQSGTYYITASAYVPAGSMIGTASLMLQTLNAKGIVQTSATPLPQGNLALKSGQWVSMIIPFQLPTDAAPLSKLRFMVLLTGLSPSGTIYLDDVGIYRMGN